ncbi:MAG: hypothetical protein HYU51_13240 [Candidatus Rokubacteria bacterium]|nr:hypothetical protein [Candidatus Rokubacteria bacterium]
MYLTWLADTRLYEVLARIDADLAETTRQAGCRVCGDVLHSARFPRKPRGGPAGLPAAYDRRHSFCCAIEGCRKRRTPPSVRFLGRKIYLGAVVVLATALRHGPTRTRAAYLRELLGVDARTLARWRQWWRDTFAESRWWTATRGRFVPPVPTTALPDSLVRRFAGDSWEPLVALLRFVVPTTTASNGAALFEGRRRPAEDAR